MHIAKTSFAILLMTLLMAYAPETHSQNNEIKEQIKKEVKKKDTQALFKHHMNYNKIEALLERHNSIDIGLEAFLEGTYLQDFIISAKEEYVKTKLYISYYGG